MTYTDDCLTLHVNSQLSDTDTSDNWKQSSGNRAGITVKDEVLLHLNELSSITFSIKNEYQYPLNEIIEKKGSSQMNVLDLINTAKALSDKLKKNNTMSADAGKMHSKYAKVPTWKDTDALVMPSTLSFDFAWGMFGLYDALEEVVKPILALSSCFMPTSSDNTTWTGPVKTTPELFAEAIADAANGSLFNSNTNTDGTAKEISEDPFKACAEIIKKYNSAVETSYGNNYALCLAAVANIKFPPFIVKNCEFTFDATQVDENGYPYRGKLLLQDCQTAEMANVGMIKKMASL